MNYIELNMLLYYADFISLKATSSPVTDSCKYYFVNNVPMNSAFLVDSQPFYDVDNKYYKQALEDLNVVKNKYGDAGVASFLEDICMLRARGVVDAEQMLKYIHQYSSRQERKQAFIDYYKWLRNQKYITAVENEQGDLVEIECSKYVAHYNKRFDTR